MSNSECNLLSDAFKTREIISYARRSVTAWSGDQRDLRLKFLKCFLQRHANFLMHKS